MTTAVRSPLVGSPVASRTWHALVAAVAGAGLVLQLLLVILDPLSDPETGAAPPGLTTRLVRFVSYFTIQSNIVVLVIAITLAISAARDGRAWRVLRLDAVIAITVTGVVHFFVLRPLQDLEGWHSLADTLLHVVSPVTLVVGWFAFGPRPRIDWPTVWWSTAWPLAWLAYTLVHGAITGWYPYPFIDVTELGYARTLINALGIAIGFVLLGCAARWVDHRLRPSPRQLGA